MAAAGSTSTATPAPTAAPVATAAATQPPQFQPRVARQGEFQGADDFHYGRGQALLTDTGPGEYTLRLENFSGRNGPDLFVYLSTAPGGLPDALLLADLKAPYGRFNSDVPAG